jgi:hypothetical protein
VAVHADRWEEAARDGDADVGPAKALLADDDDVTVAEVASRLGVSVPTLYRYLPAAASSQHQGG